jgi:Family of unknown function (DUF6233)
VAGARLASAARRHAAGCAGVPPGMRPPRHGIVTTCEAIPDDRLRVVPGYLEWQVVQIRDELARRRQEAAADSGWAVERIAHPRPRSPELRVHRATCILAILDKGTRPAAEAEARRLVRDGDAEACDYCDAALRPQHGPRGEHDVTLRPPPVRGQSHLWSKSGTTPAYAGTTPAAGLSGASRRTAPAHAGNIAAMLLFAAQHVPPRHASRAGGALLSPGELPPVARSRPRAAP